MLPLQLNYYYYYYYFKFNINPKNVIINQVKTEFHKNPVRQYFITTVKFCGLFPAQLPNYLGTGPPKKISIEFSFFLFSNKNILSFSGKICHLPRVQMANETFQHDLRSINRVQKQPGPGGNFILNNKDFSSCTLPVPGPAPELFGTTRKTLW